MNTEQKMKLEQLYKVGSDCELNSWPDSSVGSNPTQVIDIDIYIIDI